MNLSFIGYRGIVMKNKQWMINLAISNLLLVFLGVGLVIPVLPQLKEQMHFSGTTMGMMISILLLPN